LLLNLHLQLLKQLLPLQWKDSTAAGIVLHQTSGHPREQRLRSRSHRIHE
jgi:hypothetical protein